HAPGLESLPQSEQTLGIDLTLPGEDPAPLPNPAAAAAAGQTAAVAPEPAPAPAPAPAQAAAAAPAPAPQTPPAFAAAPAPAPEHSVALDAGPSLDFPGDTAAAPDPNWSAIDSLGQSIIDNDPVMSGAQDAVAQANQIAAGAPGWDGSVSPAAQQTMDLIQG